MAKSLMVGKRDIVRVKGHDLVGVVTGWASDTGGSVIRVSMGGTIKSFKPSELQRVGAVLTRDPMPPRATFWVLFSVLLATVVGGVVGWSLMTEYGMSWWASAALGFLSGSGLSGALTRIALAPARTTFKYREHGGGSSVGTTRPSICVGSETGFYWP
jgi:hypothetical protein